MVKDMNFFTPYQGQKKEQKNKNIYVYSLTGFLAVVILGTLAWNSTS
ncbi:pilus assembly protein PilN, partial [Clostridium perfringens]|nr:pilus assembly protein PilN [Clostridium perfringens]